MNITDLLPQVPIFCTLDPEEILILKKFIEKKSYKEGEPVFAEKDPGDGVYIVAVGAVKVVKSLDATHDKVLAGFHDKDFFGEMALLDGKPRSAAAVAARASVLLKISVENFDGLMHEAPFAAMTVISSGDG